MERNTINISLVFFNNIKALPISRVPCSDLAIPTPRNQKPWQLWAESNCSHIMSVSFERLVLLSICQVPYFNCKIIRARSENLLIVEELVEEDMEDSLAVRINFINWSCFLFLYIEDPNISIHTASCKESVPEGNPVNCILMLIPLDFFKLERVAHIEHQCNLALRTHGDVVRVTLVPVYHE